MAPNALSITKEIDAITSGMGTDREGMEAFRLAGGEATRAMAELGGQDEAGIGDVVSHAMERDTDNPRVEQLRQAYPDEFAVGVAIHAYKARRGQQ